MCVFFQLWVCLIVSVVSTGLSVIAVIIYSVDMDKNPEAPCIKMVYDQCNEDHYASVGISFISCHRAAMTDNIAKRLKNVKCVLGVVSVLVQWKS